MGDTYGLTMPENCPRCGHDRGRLVYAVQSKKWLCNGCGAYIDIDE